MEHLWAPWRNAYLKNQQELCKPHEGKTLFQALSQANKDEENHVIFRSETCFVVLNRYPYNLGHLLVAPYRAVANIEDLNDEESSDFWETTRQMTALVRAALKPHGVNVGINIGLAAGAGVPDHVHAHIVPRWEYDTNFMTTTGSTRVHPNDLSSVYAMFREELKKRG